VQMLIVSRFLAALATGGIQPVLQLMMTRLTDPQLRGTFFGWSGSVNTAGGILCSFIGGGIAWFSGVRGIYTASAIILALMLPALLPVLSSMRKTPVSSFPDTNQTH